MTLTALQTVPVPPIPDPQTLALALVCFIGGMTVPTRYGIERLEGFGRLIAGKLPYQAPPGRDEETAMQEAVGVEAAQETAETTEGDHAE
ncbi:hypothetical protein [Haloarcula onubensis]|uniref:Uncharacterized protein n=1 Tax=Haloarcula onubensis TaxID=2950539 RepID=A0ABU2FK14_9EURY|nr:hypothetical protein [Halomicroarcula sp. S3CR25-11]MDS0280637.1 hypothetical protein [Halomicroarcula sp. S3CR25-11]